MFKTNKILSPCVKLAGGVLGLLLGFVIIGISSSVIINLPLDLVALKRPSSSQELLTWTLALLVSIALTGGSWWWYYHHTGWGKWTKKTTLTVCVGVVCLIVVEFVLMSLNEWFNHTVTTPNNASLSVLQHHGLRGLFNLTVVILAPMMEELIYRGECQRLLTKRLSKIKHGDWWAVGFSSLVFGLLHRGGTLIGQLAYILMGVVLGLIYQRTKDLRACTLVHVVNNWLAVM